MRFLLALPLAALVLAGGTKAQGVPYGEHIVSIFQNVTTSTTGLLLVDRAANACKPVTGLSAGAQEANAVQIDPVNESVWVGTLDDAELYRITIDANCNVASETLWGQATSTSHGIQGLTFDLNGNPLAAVAGSPSSGDGVYRYDRNNAGSASLIQQASGINAICRDPAGNVYYGTASGNLFMMAVLPDCTYGSPMLLGSITPASSSSVVSGVEYCGATNELWWTSFASDGTSVGRFPLPGGPAATSTTSLPALNWIELDVVQGDFTVVTAGPDPDTVFGVSKRFATSTECIIPPNGANGVPSSIDACDCTPAETLVVPNCVVGGQVFPLEFATCCPPGFLAGVFLTQPIAVPILVGMPGPSGRLVVPPFASKTLPPGTPPGILEFTSACLDRASGRLIIGPPVTWPISVN